MSDLFKLATSTVWRAYFFMLGYEGPEVQAFGQLSHLRSPKPLLWKLVQSNSKSQSSKSHPSILVHTFAVLEATELQFNL